MTKKPNTADLDWRDMRVQTKNCVEGIVEPEWSDAYLDLEKERDKLRMECERYREVLVWCKNLRRDIETRDRARAALCPESIQEGLGVSRPAPLPRHDPMGADDETIYRASAIAAGVFREVQSEARRAALEDAAALCERTRCRNWDAKECAWQIRDQLIRRCETCGSCEDARR